jgi:hypothetical protein
MNESFNSTDFLKNTYFTSEGVSCIELCPNLRESIENGGNILITPLSKVQIFMKFYRGISLVPTSTQLSKLGRKARGLQRRFSRK